MEEVQPGFAILKLLQRATAQDHQDFLRVWSASHSSSYDYKTQKWEGKRHARISSHSPVTDKHGAEFFRDLNG